MNLIRRCLTLCLLVLLLAGFAAPAQAASSAAIRAFDDLKASTKDFAGQNLRQVEFGDAKLTEADFHGADLQGAVFNGAVLSHANLQGVNLTDGLAYLSDFGGADLTNAILDSAILLKSNFRGAKVDGADFTSALLDRDQALQLCQSASGINPVTGADTRDSLGCR
jgi:uncharacterized protein YjbI with pentapeptide repeats